MAARGTNENGQPRVEGAPSARIVVRVGKHLRLLRAEAIDWIESDSHYLRLHAGDDSYLVRQTFKSVAARLNGGGLFLRVNRTTLVNCGRIEELVSLGNNRYQVVLAGRQTFQLGRGYLAEMKRWLASVDLFSARSNDDPS